MNSVFCARVGPVPNTIGQEGVGQKDNVQASLQQNAFYRLLMSHSARHHLPWGKTGRGEREGTSIDVPGVGL